MNSITKSYGLILVFSLFFSCGKEAVEIDLNEGLAEEQISSYQKDTERNIEEVEYSGEFVGIVKGKNVLLELDEDSFVLNVNGKTEKGKVVQLDDGVKFKLESLSEDETCKYYAWVDSNQLLVLEENAKYPQAESDEGFLNRKN